MKRLGTICLLVAFATSLRAATVGQPETWATNTSGWKAVDTFSGAAKSVSNPGDRLSMTFPSQSISLPSRYRMYADETGSQGWFVGDYSAAGVKSIKLKFRCVSHIPQQARLQMFNAETGNMWWYDLSKLKVGEWVSFDVPLVYGDWWKLGTDPTKAKFDSDIKSIDWIGIRIMKNGDTATQTYELDDLELSTEDAMSPLPDSWVTENFGAGGQNSVAFANEDADGDGFSNYAEYLAGTDPNDDDSVFEVEVENDEGDTGTDIVVKWRSIANRFYTIERSSDLMSGFGELETGIPGTPPVNTYTDISATNTVPYFYRIKVRE